LLFYMRTFMRIRELKQLSEEVIPKPFDWKVFWVIIVGLLCLTGIHFFGYFDRVETSLLEALAILRVNNPSEALGFFHDPVRGQLWKLSYWNAVNFIFYLIIPLALIKFIFREAARDYGLKLKNCCQKAWIIVFVYLTFLPVLFLISATEAFQAAYPFYKNAGLSCQDFILWELSWALTFVSLEFFFRGFLLHGLKHRFGYYAVLVAAIPYCMVHFTSPLPEAIGSIIAAVFLGTLSLWIGSIWLGALLHIAVGITIDLLALLFKGDLAFL
jgi:uncharacterized protein